MNPAEKNTNSTEEQANFNPAHTIDTGLYEQLRALIQNDPLKIRFGLKGLILFHAKDTSILERAIALGYLTACVILTLFSPETVKTLFHILSNRKVKDSNGVNKKEIAFKWIAKITASPEIKKLFLDYCSDLDKYNNISALLIHILNNDFNSAKTQMREKPEIQEFFSAFITHLITQDDPALSTAGVKKRLNTQITSFLTHVFEEPQKFASIQEALESLLQNIPSDSLKRILTDSLFTLHAPLQELIEEPLGDFQKSMTDKTVQKTNARRIFLAQVAQRFNNDVEAYLPIMLKIFPSHTLMLNQISTVLAVPEYSALFDTICQGIIKNDPPHTNNLNIFNVLKKLHNEKKLNDLLESLSSKNSFFIMLKKLNIVLSDQSAADFLFSDEMKNCIANKWASADLKNLLSKFYGLKENTNAIALLIQFISVAAEFIIGKDLQETYPISMLASSMTTLITSYMASRSDKGKFYECFVHNNTNAIKNLIPFILQYKSKLLPIICKLLGLDKKYMNLLEGFLNELQNDPGFPFDRKKSAEYVENLMKDQNQSVILEKFLQSIRPKLIQQSTNCKLNPSKLYWSKALKDYITTQNGGCIVDEENKLKLQRRFETELDAILKNGHSFSKILLLLLKIRHNKSGDDVRSLIEIFEPNTKTTSHLLSFIFKMQAMQKYIPPTITNAQRLRTATGIISMLQIPNTQKQERPSN